MDATMTASPPASSRRKRKNTAHIVAFTDDPNFGDALARLADGEAIPWVEVRPGGLPAALDQESLDADIALIDIGDLAEREAVDGLRTLSARTACGVIAVGQQNDISLYRRIIAAGARDYLIVPIDERVLADALHPPDPVAPAPLSATRLEEARPRLNLIIGARGGVGTSSLAVDCAWWAAEKLGVETGLIDLDVHYGACALALDLMPGRGLRDALERPEQIDSLFVGSAMMNATERLFVMAAEEDPEDPVVTAPDAPGRLVEALSDSFPCLVVDLPRAQAGAYSDMLARADSVTLVTDLTLGGLRDSLRLKQLCAKRAPDASLALVVREQAAGKSPISRAEFEKGYGDTIDWTMGDLGKLAGDAAGSGKAMVSLIRPKHARARLIAAMAERCVGPAGLPEKKARKWLW